MNIQKATIILSIISVLCLIIIENSFTPEEISICNISKINKYYLIKGEAINQKTYNNTLFFKIRKGNCSIKSIIFNYNKKIPQGEHKFIGYLTYYKGEKEIIVRELE